MDESQSTAATEPPVDNSLLEKLLHNRLSESEARQFVSESPEYIVFTLLALQQRLAASTQSTGPNTPSAAIPPFAKPNAKPDAKKKSKKKRGGQPGHPGRTRQPLVTEDVLHRDYCPACQKRVEPKVPDVLPSCTLGNRTLVLSALLHFLQGLTISQIVDTFNFHLLRDVAAVDEANQHDEQWKSFSRRLVAIYRDAKKLHIQRQKLAGDEYDMSVARLEVRVSKLATEAWSHSDANRLSKRLEKYGPELLTFLWHDDIQNAEGPQPSTARHDPSGLGPIHDHWSTPTAAAKAIPSISRLNSYDFHLFFRANGPTVCAY